MIEKLSITQTDNHVPILHLKGNLDASTEGVFLDHARRIKESGARYLLVDLSNVDFITSAGLRAFHNSFKLFTPMNEVEQWQKQNPGDIYKSSYFKLAGASPEVYYVLNLAGFLHNIPIYPTLQEALDSFEK
jgi:hypothetical protein